MEEYTRIWKQLLDEIAKKVSSVDYDIWFSKLEPIAISFGKLILVTNLKLVQENLKKPDYKNCILQAIEVIQNPAVSDFVVILESEKDNYLSSNNIKIDNTNNELKPIFNENYTFDSFVVAPSNTVATTAAKAVAQAPGNSFNPLFIYSGVGLGKTHLIQAIGQDFLKVYPKSKIAYVSSETFTNEFINSLKDKKTNAFRDKYRKIDLLLIDDVQFFKGKEQTQEEFFHTFNDLYESKKQIVLTSDTHPNKLQGLEERLTSRFGMGFVVDIQPPDLELRTAILKRYASQSMVSVSDEVIMYLAQGINSNIRALEGAFNSVLAFAGIMNKPVSKDLVDQVLKDIIRENAGGKISISWIQKRVAEFYEITEEELTGKRRSQNLVLPRQVAMRMCQVFTDASLNQIGEKFGGRDHTTVMHSCEKINKMIKSDKAFENEFERLKRFISSN